MSPDQPRGFAAARRLNVSAAESAARAAKIDHLAELLYMHLQQLAPRERAVRLKAVAKIAERIAEHGGFADDAKAA